MIVRDTDDATQEPVSGRRVMGRAGTATIAVPGDSYTEVEFTIRASIDLPLGAWFELRLTDAGQAVPGATSGSVLSASTPQVNMSPGQRDGVPVGQPVDAHPATSRAMAGLDFPLVTPRVIAATWTNPGGVPLYRLAVAPPAALGVQAQLVDPFTSPHGPDMSLVSDTCGICHSAHTAQGAPLLVKAAPEAQMCLTCHDGTGSSQNVAAQYAAVSANDATTRSYYSHDAVSDPSLACGDCHNPHNATTTAPNQTLMGWTVAGAQAAVSGVSVNNGAAGAPPVYTLLDGTAGQQPTREYEICFKCHSGYTFLPSNAGVPPSQDELDMGIELNPSNASYHPVEAGGTNATPAMALSLSGTSPYKQWNFTTDGTVRCINCHGDPQKWDTTLLPGGTDVTAAGGDLAPHASQYRGILIQNYRDRVLKSASEPYAAADSALCLVCHAEKGSPAASSSATNFNLHQVHLANIAGEGNGGTNIDTPGDGQGNAICAECHFRIHGTALAYLVADRSNTRLVNFAPDVLPDKGSGVLTWTPTGIGAARAR